MATATATQTPPTVSRETVAPVSGLHYVIEGRPGWRYASLEEACLVAVDLVIRLRLSQSVKVREAGSELVVAMTAKDADGAVTVVRLVPR